MARVDLSDYGYVNARVRAMRAHLLTREFFTRLVEAEGFEALHNLMEQTVYRRELNEALMVNPVRPDYDQALSLNQFASFTRILEATGGEPRRLVRLLLSRYDLHNVKTILRGVRGQATAGEISSLLMPVGGLKIDLMRQMAAAREIPGLIGVMESERLGFAKPLRDAYPRFLQRDLDLAVLELELDKFHLQDVLNQLKGRGKNREMLRQIFVGEIDLRNISTMVRIRGLKLDDHEVLALRIPGGTLAPDQFLSLVRMGEIGEIVEAYPDNQYRRVLRKALEEYELVDVVAFDRELERELTREGVGMSNIDVLGIGVIIGFVFSRQNEVINLRIVFRGKSMDQPQAEIRKNLFFVERRGEEGA